MPTRQRWWGRWWARRSLRARLTAATVVVLAAGMTVAGTLLVWEVRASLMAGLDTAVVEQVQSVATQAARGVLPKQLPDADDGAPTVQVVDAEGRIIAASTGRINTFQPFNANGADDPILATVQAADDGDRDDDASYRVAAMTVTTARGSVTVYAGLPTDPVNDSTGELTAALAVGVPVIVVLLAVVAWILVGRALKPVDALRRQAAAIPGTDLHRRLPMPAVRDELGRLTDTLNDLLARIEAAGDRQRQFIADAAHELRSPIASLRAELEVRVRHGLSAPNRPDGMLNEAERLSRLVDDLLALARLDANPHPQRRPVDLDDLVLQEARRVHDRGPVVDATAVSAGRVLGDSASLARVVRNLLDNAVRHACSTITVTLSSDNAHVTFIVADDGPGIPARDRSRVFDRFTRLDEARSRDAGGVGLGLAIVQDVIRAHDGEVHIDDNQPGARFVVTLPTAE